MHNRENAQDFSVGSYKTLQCKITLNLNGLYPESNQLASLLKSFDMVQHVRGATHMDGHTLDLVVSHVTDDVVQACEVGDFISDHNAIFLALKSSKSHPVRKVTSFRKIKPIVLSEFVNDILSSELSKPLPSHVDDVALYNAVIRMLLDKHAPVRTRSRAQRKPQPWINKAILEAKRIRRQCERRWRKSTSATCRIAYKESCEEVKKRIQEAKSTYFIKQIENFDKDQQKLFQIVNNLLGFGKPSALPKYTTASSLAETFNEFFI